MKKSRIVCYWNMEFFDNNYVFENIIIIKQTSLYYSDIVQIMSYARRPFLHKKRT